MQYNQLLISNKRESQLLTFNLQIEKEQGVRMIFKENDTVQEYLIQFKDMTKVKVKKTKKNKLKMLSDEKVPDFYLVIGSFAVDKSSELRVKDKVEIFDNKEGRLKEISQLIIECNRQLLHPSEEVSEYIIRQQKVLLFVNPHSGKGKAQKVAEAVVPQLQKQGVGCYTVLTLYSQYVYEYIEHMTIDELIQFDGVVGISGDGLPHEVINALQNKIYLYSQSSLCQPSTLKRLKNIAVGQIEGGTANALIFNICHLQKEKNVLLHQLYFISKAIVRPLDLFMIQFDQQPTIVEQQENLIAQKKKEKQMEKLRRKKKKYKQPAIRQDGDKTYESLEQMESVLEMNVRREIINKWRVTFEQVYSFLSISYGIIADIDLQSEGLRWLGSTRFDLYGLVRFCKLYTYSATLYYSQQPQVEMPALDQPLDNHPDFTKVEGQFIHFFASKLPFVSPSTCLNPEYMLEDDYFNISYFLQGDGRFKLLQLLLSLDGKGSSLKYMHYVKARAFRFVPHSHTQQSHYSIDGEQYPSRAIQATLIKNTLNTYAQF